MSITRYLDQPIYSSLFLMMLLSGCVSHNLVPVEVVNLNHIAANEKISEQRVALNISPEACSMIHTSKYRKNCSYDVNIGPALCKGLENMTKSLLNVTANEEEHDLTLSYKVSEVDQSIAFTHSLGSGTIHTSTEIKLHLSLIDANGKILNNSVLEGDSSFSKTVGFATCSTGIAPLQKTTEEAIEEAIQLISNELRRSLI